MCIRDSRNGARHVTCYARRDEECISASEHEVRYAKLEGVGDVYKRQHPQCGG